MSIPSISSYPEHKIGSSLATIEGDLASLPTSKILYSAPPMPTIGSKHRETPISDLSHPKRKHVALAFIKEEKYITSSAFKPVSPSLSDDSQEILDACEENDTKKISDLIRSSPSLDRSTLSIVQLRLSAKKVKTVYDENLINLISAKKGMK